MSQVLTLFTTPVIYLMFDRISQRFGRKAGRALGRAGRVNIPAIFINRPVATSLLAIAIALSGLLAYFRMPVAPLPNVTMPVVAVQANMAGASPDIMASTVAEPLERRLATIAGVNELTSQSSVGSAQVVIQFAINRDINGAARDVEAAIQAARADLPTTLRGNPSYRKFNPADSPIIILGAHLEDSYHGPALRFRRHRHSAAALPDLRRRSDPAGRQRPALGAGRDPAR